MCAEVIEFRDGKGLKQRRVSRRVSVEVTDEKDRQPRLHSHLTKGGAENIVPTVAAGVGMLGTLPKVEVEDKDGSGS